jgi:hypothetical protein
MSAAAAAAAADSAPEAKRQKTETGFTPLADVRVMLSALQQVPQTRIPVDARKHIIGRIKACLVERADAFRAAEFKDLRRDQVRMKRIRPPPPPPLLLPSSPHIMVMLSYVFFASGVRPFL